MPDYTVVDYVSAERFWSKVNVNLDGCWVWTAFASRYGQFNDRGQRLLAHRVAWALWHGQDPGDLYVLHHCDNPPCVRPDHLYLGTPKDNMRDKVVRGRHPETQRTHCPQGHPYAGDNLIRRANGKRDCRACKLAYMRLRYEADPERFKTMSRQNHQRRRSA